MFMGNTLLAQCLSSTEVSIPLGLSIMATLGTGESGSCTGVAVNGDLSNCIIICDCGGVNCLFNLVPVCTSPTDVIFTMHFNIGRNRTDSQATWSSHLCRTLTLNTARYGFHGHFFIIVILSCLIKVHLTPKFFFRLNKSTYCLN